ncbi:MAG: transglutaminase family protein [Acidimicrobiales bacterium]|nr:transglutaminase family protein [Acidimicrobiales bacterium]
MDVPGRWAELMRLPEARVPLDEAALLISARANPALDVYEQLARLDELAGRVNAPDTSELCQLLFGRLGLRGNRDRYDDPDNSYLDQVLDRRLGIPISLSVVLIEVGRRCGVELQAVGMPGHFLVRDPAAPGQLIDAFDAGRRLDHGGCEQLLQAVTAGAGRLTPEMLATTGTWAILTRMLANLDRSFERRGDHKALAWVTDMRVPIPDAPVGDRVHLATRLAGLGRLDTASGVLERAASTLAESPARAKLVAQASDLRARLN